MPIIADIDAGNAEPTYLLPKKMIEAGACALQIENQVSDEKQCSHQDGITPLQNGADLLWIETEKPHVEQVASMMDRIRAVVPNAKLAYNNSPLFNWTLNFRQQVYDAWQTNGNDVSAYDRTKLMSVDYDETPLAAEADRWIQTFQADAAKRAGIFHHLITLPT